MSALTEFLKAFPALWAIMGLLVGGGIMLWVTKKYGPMRNDALKEVVSAYREQIKVAAELAETMAQRHMAQLAMQKDHWSEELGKMERARDDYRDQLHQARNDLGAEITTLRMKNQELELRPSVEVLQSEQKTFYSDLSATMKGIAISLKDHEDKLDERLGLYFKPLHDACASTAKAMSELVKTLRLEKAA